MKFGRVEPAPPLRDGGDGVVCRSRRRHVGLQRDDGSRNGPIKRHEIRHAGYMRVAQLALARLDHGKEDAAEIIGSWPAV